MKIIKRKTNVREHNRQTKHKVADVKNHERNLKPKQVLGTIQLKNLNYKQSKKRFPFIEPNGDLDEDGVINKRDCHPFDVERQDDEDEEHERERSEKQQEYLDERDEGNIENLRNKTNDPGFYNYDEYAEHGDEISNYEYEQRREAAGLKRKGDIW